VQVTVNMVCLKQSAVNKIISQYETNVFDLMDVIRAILPHFRANNGGTVRGLIGLPTMSIYSSSKFLHLKLASTSPYATKEAEAFSIS
jgi:short-subunit dehydrogenase